MELSTHFLSERTQLFDTYFNGAFGINFERDCAALLSCSRPNSLDFPYPQTGDEIIFNECQIKVSLVIGT